MLSLLIYWKYNTDELVGTLKWRFFKAESGKCGKGKLQAWCSRLCGQQASVAGACSCLNWCISSDVNEMMQIYSSTESCLKSTFSPRHRRKCLQDNWNCSFKKLHLPIFTLGLSICNYMHFNGLLLIYTAGIVHFPRPALTIYWPSQHCCEEGYYSRSIDKQGLHFGECLDLVHTFDPLLPSITFLLRALVSPPPSPSPSHHHHMCAGEWRGKTAQIIVQVQI